MDAHCCLIPITNIHDWVPSARSLRVWKTANRSVIIGAIIHLLDWYYLHLNYHTNALCMANDSLSKHHFLHSMVQTHANKTIHSTNLPQHQKNDNHHSTMAFICAIITPYESTCVASYWITMNETTQACISSLEQSQHKNIQIIVIDNHSSSSPRTWHLTTPYFHYLTMNTTKKILQKTSN